TAQIGAAPGKGRDTLLSLEDENLPAAKIHGHRLSEWNSRLSADQHGLRLLTGLGRQQELEKPETEGADAEQQAKSHDGLAEEASAPDIVVYDGHALPRVAFLTVLMKIQSHPLRLLVDTR